MIKKDLVNMRPLVATPKMMKMAATDTPQVKKYYWKEELTYKNGLYLRCHIQGGILKVAFFLTEAMRSGGRLPAYELYISKERRQFITYDRLYDKWLHSKLDRLDWPSYAMASENKWISQADNNALKDYFGGEKGGYYSLLDFQLQIREAELIKRHKKETDPWDADLAPVPALPKDWNRWVSKVGIRENYIYYQYSKKGADTGYCTYCEKDVPIKQPRYNARRRCPRCRHSVIFKSVGKVGTIITPQNLMYLIQRFRDGFIIRMFDGYRRHPKGDYKTPVCSYSEIRRAIYDKNGKALRAYYWGYYKQREMRWILTGVYRPSYWSDWLGMVYGKTLPHLAKIELSRSGLIEMISNFKLINPERYLAVLDVVPQLEKFAKAKLSRIAHECCMSHYGFSENIHNIDASSLTGMLGINTQELKRLRQNNGGLRFLEWLRYENALGKPIRDKDIVWLCSENIAPKDIQFIMGKMSIIQICNYIRRQMSVYNENGKDIIGTWADYLSMAKRQKMNTDDEIIFRVNKLRQRHDELVERCHEKSFALQAGQIIEDYPHVDDICESLMDKYEYADSEYTILAPTRIEDILQEGRDLHHCIANSDRYWERIERRESFVLFLRRSSDVAKSYYTLEVEPNGTIRQKRTMYDRQEPDIEEANVFLRKWQEVIAGRLTQDDRKLAEESRVMRLQSYAQLRTDQVIINTGALAGQLLVDVLLADLMENAAV